MTQRLAVYCGIPLVALGATPTDFPPRGDIRCLGVRSDLASLTEQEVLYALGF